ncbi:F0F1 ATP synthase subunit delta [Thiolinea disciformis]|uniref:F0F1 ATP synthase subunit delta n=1 Tax=Thiolinea disciformis TaxID=125614 RepID=UPI00037CC632|nr:F0F1 ATP synthase subunit delta [Thiolinea disciformis]
MSELTTAARPYAKAVFEMAQQDGTLANWSAQLAAMSAVVSAEGAAKLLANPRLSKEQKVDLIADIAGDALYDKGHNLLNVLAENDRFALLPEISVLFEQMRADAEGTVDVDIVSAYKLDDKQQKMLTAALQKRFGRNVKLTTSVDSSLMGGAIIRAGDLVIDGSIQSRLKDMKAALSR